MSIQETIRYLVHAEESLAECRRHLCDAFLALPDNDPLGLAIKERCDALWADERPHGAHGNGTYFHFVALAITDFTRRMKT